MKNLYNIEMIKELRSNMTKVDFARTLGVSKQLYQKVENGEYKELPIPIVQNIKNRFGLNAEEILILIGIH